MRTIIWYTDAITALVRAAVPLLDAIEEASERDDVELKRYLLLTYNPLVSKINECVARGFREEEWTARELSTEDALSLARINTPKGKAVRA
jgi:hypothetical protein